MNHALANENTSVIDPAQLNRLLASLGMPKLTLRQINALTTDPVDGKHVRDAMDNAAQDPAWRQWLAAAVQRAIVAAPAQAPAPAPAPDAAGSDEGLPSVAQPLERPGNSPTARAATEQPQPQPQPQASRNNVRPMHRPDFPERGRTSAAPVDQPQSAPAQSGNNDAQRAGKSRDIQPPRFDQVTAYGKDTGIQFERCPNIERTVNTINVSIAKAKDGASAKNGLNWDAKIQLMLVPHEVQLIAAVLHGMLPKARFAGHGHSNEKWIEVERQTGQWAGVRFTIAQDKSDIRRVNVGYTDIGNVTAIFMRTLQDQMRLQANAILPTIKATASIYHDQTTARAANREGQQPRAAAG